MIAARRQHAVLAGELGGGVHVERIGPIALDIGGPLRTVEDVVGADVHEARAELGAEPGQARGAMAFTA
jgi:hypothetical protein